MFVRIWNKSKTDYKNYTEIKNLSFSPEVDTTGETVSIDELYVDIKTTDPVILGAKTVGTISTGRYIMLLDDRDIKIWATYKIVLAERLDYDFVRIHAQSVLGRLDNRMVKAEMYENDRVYDVFSDLFRTSEMYSLDNAFDDVRITGYCPRQTAKERLQMICFAIGAIVRTSFSEAIEIIPLGNVEKDVPLNKVYWKPSISYTDYVTDIVMTSFAFTETPKADMISGNEYVKANGKYYLVERTENILTNPNAQQDIDAREIVFDNVYLINSNNVDEILSHLALTYFSQLELNAEILNNADYIPADLVCVPTDPIDPIAEGNTAVGYIDSCAFTFGLQAKSQIHLRLQELRETTKLIINYMRGNKKLGKKVYSYPVGYNYSIQNPYLDQTTGRHRYVYYPKNEQATGTIEQGTNVNNQPYEIALHYKSDGSILEIISVAGVSWQGDKREVMVIE